MTFTLAQALVFWPALCAVAFAWEHATRPHVCGLCANTRPLVGLLATTHDYVGVCADCYTLTHTMERTTNV